MSTTEVVSEIKLDVTGNTSPYVTIRAKQGDYKMRSVVAQILCDGNPIVISEDDDVVVNFNRGGDNKHKSYFVYSKNADNAKNAIGALLEGGSTGCVKFSIPYWVLELPYSVRCDISIVGAQETTGGDIPRLTTLDFFIRVESAAVSDNDIIDDDEVSYLATLLGNKDYLEDNYVTRHTAQDITGAKTFKGTHAFTGETKFTHSEYAPTFTEIASGVGKSSCFTRGAHMQVITGQVIAPNASVSDDVHSYNTESGKIKFQKILATGKTQKGEASMGQFQLEDMAVLSSDGLELGKDKKKVATVDQIPTSNVSGTSGTLPKFTGTNSIGTSSVTQSSANDITIGGKLIVKSSGSTSGNSFNEGIRVLPASNGWSELFFSNEQTTSGKNEKGWILGKRGAAGSTSGEAGDFTIECNGSSGNGLTLYADGSRPRWQSNELAYKTDIPTNYVTTNTAQTIAGAKTFTSEINAQEGGIYVELNGENAFKVGRTDGEANITIDGGGTGAVPLILDMDAGTSGQVLTSQGAGATPKWSDKYKIVDLTFASDGTTNPINGNDLEAVKDPGTIIRIKSGSGRSVQIFRYSYQDGGYVWYDWINYSLYFEHHFLKINLSTGTIVWYDTSLVTLTGTEPISGKKTFTGGVDLTSNLLANGSAGTSGQVLTSQGSGSAPVWTTPSSGGGSDLVQIRVSSCTKVHINTTDPLAPPAKYNVNVVIDGGLSNLREGDLIQCCKPQKCKERIMKDDEFTGKYRIRWRYQQQDSYRVTAEDIAKNRCVFSIELAHVHAYNSQGGGVRPPYTYGFNNSVIGRSTRHSWAVRVQRDIDGSNYKTVSNIGKFMVINGDGRVVIRPV